MRLSLLRSEYRIVPKSIKWFGKSRFPHFSTKSHTLERTFGVVFDVDGVLLRGKKAIPGAAGVIRSLKVNNIPFAILTNNGGTLEATKAALISKILGEEIPSHLVCMSHTPMRAPHLVEKHKDELILVVGKDCDAAKQVMLSYGYENSVTISELHHHFPALYPDFSTKLPGTIIDRQRLINNKFGAVFVLIDPIYWGRELQLAMDILCSDNGVLGTSSTRQTVPLYSACTDFHYVGEHHVPRYGAGAFGVVMQDLYFRTTGHKLALTQFGKPEKPSFEFAASLVDNQHPNVDTIYMIGDNPETDIKGANTLGGRWKSILTLTGMHAPEGQNRVLTSNNNNYQLFNHHKYPAYRVVPDVVAAFEFMQQDYKFK